MHPAVLNYTFAFSPTLLMAPPPVPKLWQYPSTYTFTAILFIHVSLHATPASFGLLRIRQSVVEHGAGDSQQVNATWSSVCCPAPVSIANSYIINTLRGRRIPRTALFNPISTIPHRGSLFEVLTQHSSQIGWNGTLNSTELCHEIVILSDCSCSWLKPKEMATLRDAQQHPNSLNCYHSQTSMVKEGESYQATEQKSPHPEPGSPSPPHMKPSTHACHLRSPWLLWWHLEPLPWIYGNTGAPPRNQMIRNIK